MSIAKQLISAKGAPVYKFTFGPHHKGIVLSEDGSTATKEKGWGSTYTNEPIALQNGILGGIIKITLKLLKKDQFLFIGVGKKENIKVF